MLRTERCWTEPRSRAEQTWNTHTLCYCNVWTVQSIKRWICFNYSLNPHLENCFKCTFCFFPRESRCIHNWLNMGVMGYDLRVNQCLQWQADSWLHLRLINKQYLALRLTSIYHTWYSDCYTSSRQQHRLSGCIKLDYSACNTDVNGSHFILQCCIMRYNPLLQVVLIIIHNSQAAGALTSIKPNLSIYLLCYQSDLISLVWDSWLTWSNEQSVLERSRVTRLLGWLRKWQKC